MKPIRKRPYYPSVKARLTWLLALAWLIPVMLVVYYFDIQRRADVTFREGINYAAELSWERMAKTISDISAMPPERLLKAQTRPPNVSIVVMESDTPQVQDFGVNADYVSYAENDRALLLATAERIDETSVLWGAPSGRLYLARGVFETVGDEKRRVGVFVVEVDRAYVLSFFLDNTYGGATVDIKIANATMRLKSGAADGTLTLSAAPAGEDLDAMRLGRDAIGAIGPGIYGIYYYADMDKAALIADYRALTALTVAIVIICPLLIALSAFLYRSVTRPITRLMAAINEIERGAFGAQVDHGHEDEFAHLARAFNGMSANLQAMIDRAKQQDAANRDARLLALRAQINPHFINNTLEFLNWKARLNDADGVSKMVSALSVLLEGAMGRERAALLPLEQELTYADAYLSVIGQRFGEHVRIERDIDPAALEALVPPLMLQPLLENAVIHGIEPLGGGRIALKARATDGLVILRVENDGQISEADIARANRHMKETSEGGKPARLGVHNVAERLALLYDGAARLRLFADNGGTVAEIEIPIDSPIKN